LLVRRSLRGIWEFADSWVLLAIGTTREGDLESVIVAADYIDVSIPSFEEFQASVGRLVAAGLVDTRNDRLSVTAAGRTLIDGCRGREGIRLVPPKITAKLAAEVPFPEKSAAWVLSPTDWKDAFERYWRSRQ
jgi:hypothetical protein